MRRESDDPLLTSPIFYIYNVTFAPIDIRLPISVLVEYRTVRGSFQEPSIGALTAANADREGPS